MCLENKCGKGSNSCNICNTNYSMPSANGNYGIIQSSYYSAGLTGYSS